ncbi:hypothetical protein O9929_03285 [Vibrio lentus]|nr:hypothetical protein [Vibrio lentus]
MVNGDGNIAKQHSYSASAQLSHVQYGNGMQSDYEYDALDRQARNPLVIRTEHIFSHSIISMMRYQTLQLSPTNEQSKIKRHCQRTRDRESIFRKLDQLLPLSIALEQNKLKLTQYRLILLVTLLPRTPTINPR